MPVYLIPAKGFGSGDHPTTQLCLRSLENTISRGSALIDLGAGTGILSIAGAKLGAQPILAVDIDPAAVDEARENFRLNDLAHVIDVRNGSLNEAMAWPRSTHQTTNVVANILTRVLGPFLAQGLAELPGPDGWLILSGILRPQTAIMYAGLQAAGLQLRAQEQQEDWVCLVAQCD